MQRGFGFIKPDKTPDNEEPQDLFVHCKAITRPRLLPIHLRIGQPIEAPISRRKVDLELTTRNLQSSINCMLEQGLVQE